MSQHCVAQMYRRLSNQFFSCQIFSAVHDVAHAPVQKQYKSVLALQQVLKCNPATSDSASSSSSSSSSETCLDWPKQLKLLQGRTTVQGKEQENRKTRKCHSESDSFVAAVEQVCLQPLIEHRQRRGRCNVAWQAIFTFDPATRKARPLTVDQGQVRTSRCS